MIVALLGHYFFGITIFVTSLFLVMLVLVQRGRGGGLTGALGGPGGQSAFGTKAGDLFTRITVAVAAIWIALCASAVFFLKEPPIATGLTTTGGSTMGAGATTGSDTENGSTDSSTITPPATTPATSPSIDAEVNALEGSSAGAEAAVDSTPVEDSDENGGEEGESAASAASEAPDSNQP